MKTHKHPHYAAVAVAAGVLFFLQSASAFAPSPRYEPIEAERFKPFGPGLAESALVSTPAPSVRLDIPEHVALLPEPPGSALRRPQIRSPQPMPGQLSRVKPKQPQRSSSNGSLVTGIASWYCLAGQSICHRDYPDRAGPDLFAAAGPALRTGHWRGRVVTVCADGCVQVKLVDWCACGGGRVIDLYADAFNRISNLSAGVVRVRVR